MINPSGPILVAGAGVGGLTAALAMSRHGIAVTVFERRSQQEITTSAGFGHTIWSNATTSLARLGLGDRLREVGERLVGSEARNSRQEVLFQVEIAKSITPGAMPALGIGRADLVRLLRDACLEHGVPIRYGTAVTGVEQVGGGVAADLGDGGKATGAALIGADGVRSTVHTGLHGALPLVNSGRSAYRAIASGTCGLRPGVVHLFSDPDSRIGGGAWQIGGDRVVWTLSCDRPPDGDDPQGTWAHAEELAGMLGEIPRMFVSQTPRDTISRTPLFYHDWIGSWGTGAVTLLGDAAHAMPTDLGQGACQAIEDGVVLADALAAAQDVVSGLRAYEARRRPRVWWIRRRVMRVNDFTPVKNPVARWAVTKIAKVVVEASAPKMWREIQRPPNLTAEPPATQNAVTGRATH